MCLGKYHKWISSILIFKVQTNLKTSVNAFPTMWHFVKCKPSRACAACMVFVPISKLDLTVLECDFCVGKLICMKWMNNAFRCWSLCFRMILWCLNSVDTTHVLLWEKSACLDCEIMTCSSATIFLQFRGNLFWFVMAQYKHCFKKT